VLIHYTEKIIVIQSLFYFFCSQWCKCCCLLYSVLWMCGSW